MSHTKSLLLRSLKSYSMILQDLLLLIVAFFIAMYLRIGDDYLNYSNAFILKNLIVYSTCAVSLMMLLEVYGTIWRFFSIEDMLPITIAVLLGTIIYYPLMLLLVENEAFPKSVIFINMFTGLFMLSLPRFAVRFMHDFKVMQDKSLRRSLSMPVLLVGTSDVTELFVRETRFSMEVIYHPIGIIAIDEQDEGHHIHGVPIVGHLSEIISILENLASENRKPRQIIITEDHLSKNDQRLLSEAVDQFGILLVHLTQHFSMNVVKPECNFPSQQRA